MENRPFDLSRWSISLGCKTGNPPFGKGLIWHVSETIQSADDQQGRMSNLRLRVLLIMLLITIHFGFCPAVHAEKWIDFGPAYMPLSAFQGLEAIVAGSDDISHEKGGGVSPMPAFVELGMASMPQSEYKVMVDLIERRYNENLKKSLMKDKYIYLGIVVLRESELESLRKIMHSSDKNAQTRQVSGDYGR